MLETGFYHPTKCVNDKLVRLPSEWRVLVPNTPYTIYAKGFITKPTRKQRRRVHNEYKAMIAERTKQKV